MHFVSTLKKTLIMAKHTPPLWWLVCTLPATIDYVLHHQGTDFLLLSNFKWWQLCGSAILFIIGFIIAADALLTFKKYLVSPLPFTIKRHRIITTGIYAISRNPMYLSLLFFHGACVMLLAPWYLIATWPLLFSILTCEIKREEFKLGRRFPEYEAYCAKVRRWL